MSENKQNQTWHLPHINGKMMRVQKMRRAVVEARVASLNVSQSQFHVLHEIMHAQRHGNGAPLSQKDLAERLGISAAAVAMMMKRMEKDGYLTRVVSEKDNRFNELHLTEKSLEILHQSRDIFDGLDVIAFQGISDEELEVFCNCLEKIKSNLLKLPELKDRAEYRCRHKKD
ncbi:MAG: MarR family transcriptional regulator [Clostridia bacterium]|nr:MarR family transcriptional regulator [Clostridia bacterium]